MYLASEFVWRNAFTITKAEVTWMSEQAQRTVRYQMYFLLISIKGELGNWRGFSFDRSFRYSRVLNNFYALQFSLDQLRVRVGVFQSTKLPGNLCFPSGLHLHVHCYFPLVPSGQEKIFFANQKFRSVGGKINFGNYNSHYNNSNLLNVSLPRFLVPRILLPVSCIPSNVYDSKLSYLWRCISAQKT